MKATLQMTSYTIVGLRGLSPTFFMRACEAEVEAEAKTKSTLTQFVNLTVPKEIEKMKKSKKKTSGIMCVKLTFLRREILKN